MRNVVDVIDALAAIDGADPDFVTQLETLRSSAVYRAPEQSRQTWEELLFLFNACIPPENPTPWQKKAISIFCDILEEAVQ